MTIPFYIMHLDIRSPGNVLVNHKDGGHLLNCMCDLTQFVVSCILTDTSAAALAEIFMAQVVLSFGMVAIVVVDADNRFRSTFEAMCKSLKLTFWPLARGNHKGNSVERYHRFLNKTQTIAGQDRNTNEVFHQKAKTSQYGWNSSPIDDTDIPRCVAALGREFRFPLDVELLEQPCLNDKNNSALFHYLRNVSCNSKFAVSVLQILLEERRTAHRERHNKDRVAVKFNVGDVVKAHVQVQSKLSTGEVGKLSYAARGPFTIVEDLGGDSYHVQRYNDRDSAIRKYKGTDLYLLPPAIFPSDPLDTMDVRYLNYSNAPIVHPLKKALKIEVYNDMIFDKPPNLQSDSTDNLAVTWMNWLWNPTRFHNMYLRQIFSKRVKRL